MIVVTLIVCVTILVWKMLDVMAENPELFKEEKKYDRAGTTTDTKATECVKDTTGRLWTQDNE